jgi:GAF domain-containing protein
LATQIFNSLEQVLAEMEKQSSPLALEQLDQFSHALAGVFRLKADEVAILEILPPGRMLRFVLPEKLRATGTIPLSSSSALAARTARLRRTGIVNNFSSLPHASVFEGVPLGRGQEESIHKIMSAPIFLENRVIGVVQFCRKGITPMDAGPDFTALDLDLLKNLNDLLARFLTLRLSS